MPILDDAIFEKSESFTVMLSGAVNAIDRRRRPAIGTILDDGTGAGGTDNDTPTLCREQSGVTEGTDTHAVFTVGLLESLHAVDDRQILRSPMALRPLLTSVPQSRSRPMAARRGLARGTVTIAAGQTQCAGAHADRE